MIEPNREENNKNPENLQEVPLIDQSTATQKQSINGEKQRFLVLLDVTICFTVITFLVVACWRGTWQLMNIYYVYFPMWETFIVSSFVHVTFTLCQSVFHEVLLEDKNEKRFIVKAVHFCLRRLYLFVFYLMGIAQWSSIWNILDAYPKGTTSEILLTTICILFFVLLGALTNISSTPMTIEVDDKEGTFLFETGLFYKVGDKTSLYVLDCLFSVLIVGSLVVFVWRGVWLILDLVLFPDDLTVSSWGSLVLGYSCVIVAFLLQPAMRYVCERLSGFARLFVADSFILFALFGTVNVWRGIWNLLNIYFLPDNLELSCWITHWVCLIILTLCRCSNSLLVRGVYIDAEEPAGKCVVFPCYYLRVIFRKKKLKKLNLASISLDAIVEVNHKDHKGVENHVHISTITSSIEENNSAGRR